MSTAAFEYKYKVNGLNKVSAQIAGEICHELSESEEGLTPKRLVDVSRDESAPLHGEFEWDNTIAAEHYREQQASQLIRNIVIVKSEAHADRELKLIEKKPELIQGDNEVIDTTKDRGFVSTGERNSKYVTIAAALSNEQWRANLLKSAKQDLYAFKVKYYRLEELAKIMGDIDDLLGA